MTTQNAAKDENGVSSVLGSSSDGDGTTVEVYADPDTHRLLVDGIGATGPTGSRGATGPTGATGATGPTGPAATTVANGTYTPVTSITVLNGVITAIS